MADTPSDVIATFSNAIERVLADPLLLKSMEAQGVELKFTRADEFGKMIGQEFVAWGDKT